MRSSYLSASLTHMGLLASVDAGMDGQCRPLDELLPAANKIADMRANSTVDAFWKTSQH